MPKAKTINLLKLKLVPSKTFYKNYHATSKCETACFESNSQSFDFRAKFY